MNRADLLRIAVVVLFALLAVAFLPHWASSARQQNPPAAAPSGGQQAPRREQEEPKNLQVLKGMSRQQVFSVMQNWASSLGVQCNYCHVRPFEADTARKSTARLMQHDYVMSLKQKDGQALTCKDCHQGQPNFLRVRAFEGAVGQKLPDIRVLKGMDRERLMEVMQAFTKALGVQCNYCHTGDFDEDTPRKQIARFMMTEFSGKLVKQDGSRVGCADCHQGHALPLTSLPFPRPPERRSPPAGGAPQGRPGE